MKLESPSHAGPGIAVLKPAGQLTGEAAADLKEQVRGLLGAGEDVVLDFGAVSFADSEGLSALVAIFKTACNEGRRVVLVSLRANFRALLELTRLHRVFDVMEDVEAAVAALGAGR